MRCDIPIVPVPMRTLFFNQSTDPTITNNRNGTDSFLEFILFQKNRRIELYSIWNANSFSNAGVWDTSMYPTTIHKVRVEPYQT
jgi:hypothetical protein